MKIGFIGTGNMSKALILGGLSKISKENIYIANKTHQKAVDFAEKTGVCICENNTQLVEKCDIIIIGVKPNMYEEVLNEIYKSTKGKVLVSIAPGLSLEFLYSKVCDDTVFVRTMPNTPAQVLSGMTAICFDKKISDTHKEYIKKYFKSVGEITEVLENEMDLVVGLSGSSPAYAYMFIDALAKAGEKLGMDKEKALKLSANAVLGAGKMILETGTDPQVLTQNVCSKGGTTIEGVLVLQEDIDALLEKTVNAVVEKSKKLTK